MVVYGDIFVVWVVGGGGVFDEGVRLVGGLVGVVGVGGLIGLV